MGFRINMDSSVGENIGQTSHHLPKLLCQLCITCYYELYKKRNLFSFFRLRDDEPAVAIIEDKPSNQAHGPEQQIYPEELEADTEVAAAAYGEPAVAIIEDKPSDEVHAPEKKNVPEELEADPEVGAPGYEVGHGKV